MKAVILAGGFGVRFRPLTFSKPKPMIPLLDKPLVEHILDYLGSYGVDEVFITTNYLKEQIIDHLGYERNGIKLNYPEEKEPLGTAGSVRNIADKLGETFIVVQGDTVTDINLHALITDHKYYGGLCTIALTTIDEPWNFGVVELYDNGRVKRFVEKPLMSECASNLINTGIYVLEPEALNFVPESTFFDFAKDLFPRLVDRESIYASRADGFWVDVGRPEGYKSARDWMVGRMESHISPTAVVDAQLHGNVFVGDDVVLKRHSEIFGPVYIGDGTVIEENCIIGPKTVIGPAITVKEYNVIQGGVLFEKSVVGSNELIGNALIGESCVIGNGSRIQSEVIIGSNCVLEEYVSVVAGSRIWPNMKITGNSFVSGTIRQFIPPAGNASEPAWNLRVVTPEEAFYFNKNEGGHILFTGLRAKSLLEFNDVLHDVEHSSLSYHMRGDVNDFREWFKRVIGDVKLAGEFEGIKREISEKTVDDTALKRKMIETTRGRLGELISEALKGQK